MLVLRITFLVPFGGLLKASNCCKEGRVAYSGQIFKEGYFPSSSLKNKIENKEIITVQMVFMLHHYFGDCLGVFSYSFNLFLSSEEQENVVAKIN